MRLLQDFRYESLTFIAFFTTLPLYSPNLVVFGGDTTLVNMDAFAPTMLVATLVVACLYVLLPESRWPEKVWRRWGLLVGTVCYLAGILLFYWLTAFSSSTLLAMLAAVLAAVGLVPLCVAWGAVLMHMDLRQAIFWLSLMCAAAAGLIQMLSIWPSYPFMVAMLLVGVAVPVVKELRGTLMMTPETLSANPTPTSTDADIDALLEARASGQPEAPAAWHQEVAANLRRLLSVIMPVLIGLLVFAFTMGLRKYLFFDDTVHGENLGAWLAILVVIPLCRFRTDKPLFSFIYQVFLPGFAVLVIFLDSFPAGSMASTIGLAALYVFYGVVGVITVATLCAVAHAREFSPRLVFSLPLALFAGISYLGILCGSWDFLADNSDSFLLVVSTAYLAYLVFNPTLHAWRQTSMPSHKAASAAQVAAGFDERCAAMATQYALSPREQEILGYLGHGYSPAYIAKTLLISDSTARVHVRNIYRKIGVSSREELLGKFS